ITNIRHPNVYAQTRLMAIQHPKGELAVPDDLLARMLVSLGLVLGLLGALTWAVKKYGARLGLPMVLKQGKSRLQLMDVMPLDARHRMVLVRRDDVEHLLLLGGTQPVVVETNIPPKAPSPAENTHEKK
ncbi:MAG: flagellar biosynthetic protein FliO, partial [Alphaproteobacteria bacterium]|nr:flagellar biosynthetic protein FliO [Alphaproteobacteria bacterium]